jgi:DNA-binding XRE family transcriptional regulator
MRNLILVRAAKGYSQEEMAEKIGVSKVAYASYEYGTREGTVKAWIKLEEILDTPIREIYRNIPKPPRVRKTETEDSKTPESTVKGRPKAKKADKKTAKAKTGRTKTGKEKK